MEVYADEEETIIPDAILSFDLQHGSAGLSESEQGRLLNPENGR